MVHYLHLFFIAFIYSIVVISCPPNFETIAMQKATTNTVVRKEIRSTIKNILNLTENVVVDEEAFTKLSSRLDIENSTEYFVQFQNAVNEISETSYEACYGSKDKLALAEEIPILIDNFDKIVDSESSETRYIFGRLLCLHQKFQTNTTLVTKREINYDELLEMWFNELKVKQFHKLFNFTSDYLSLAFVVDNTGSMSQEIAAVKSLIKTIIKAERTSPFFYILGTFNDPGNNIQHCFILFIHLYSDLQ